MDKQNVVYTTIEYYSGKEILSNTKTCMNLEDIILREMSQSKRDKHCMIPFM